MNEPMLPNGNVILFFMIQKMKPGNGLKPDNANGTAYIHYAMWTVS